MIKMFNKFIRIPKEYKGNSNKPFSINGIEIFLPPYVLKSVSMYAFKIINNEIILYRRCNHCNSFIQVQKYINDKFENLPKLQIAFNEQENRFEYYCNSCISNKIDNEHLKNSNKENSYDKVQLNIKVTPELKKRYKILAAENNTSLNTELVNALLHYIN